MSETFTAEENKVHTRDMLQKQMYVVFTKPTGSLSTVLAHLDEHLAFQVDLERRGIMFGAGPFWSDDGNWEGEGMVIIRAGSLEEAREIAESDPMHRAGARSFTVRSWMMNEGTFSLRFSYSDQKVVFE